MFRTDVPLIDMLSVKEASGFLKVSPSKIYQLITRRSIPSYRIGGKILLSKQDIAEFLESCHIGAVAPVTTAPRAQPKLRHLQLG